MEDRCWQDDAPVLTFAQQQHTAHDHDQVEYDDERAEQRYEDVVQEQRRLLAGTERGDGFGGGGHRIDPPVRRHRRVGRPDVVKVSYPVVIIVAVRLHLSHSVSRLRIGRSVVVVVASLGTLFHTSHTQTHSHTQARTRSFGWVMKVPKGHRCCTAGQSRGTGNRVRPGGWLPSVVKCFKIEIKH